MREKIRNLVMEYWPYIVGYGYNDAKTHVILKIGQLYESRDKELIGWRDHLLKCDPDGLFDLVEEMLKKAKTDSILHTR